jgi:hypothetical protein
MTGFHFGLKSPQESGPKPLLLSPQFFAILRPAVVTREHQARETFKCHNRRFVPSVPAISLNESGELVSNI